MNRNIKLRKVHETDLKYFFNHQKDEEANYMVAFTYRDPNNWEEFIKHWKKILNNEKNIIRTILFENQIAGNILSFIMQGKREVGYWIGKDFWGNGITTFSLKLFLEEIKERPLFAHVAFDNIGSIRVLEKCGFIKIAEDNFFAKARDKEIQEFIFSLES